jgi:hypothetical protein
MLLCYCSARHGDIFVIFAVTCSKFKKYYEQSNGELEDGQINFETETSLVAHFLRMMMTVTLNSCLL